MNDFGDRLGAIAHGVSQDYAKAAGDDADALIRRAKRGRVVWTGTVGAAALASAATLAIGGSAMANGLFDSTIAPASHSPSQSSDDPTDDATDEATSTPEATDSGTPTPTPTTDDDQGGDDTGSDDDPATHDVGDDNGGHDDIVEPDDGSGHGGDDSVEDSEDRSGSNSGKG